MSLTVANGVKSEQCEVVCVGETLAMIAPQQQQPLDIARTFAIHPAGAESNVALYLANLGHHVSWVSRLGNDSLGRRVLREITAAGVDTSLVEIDERSPTGVAFKDPGSENTIVYYYRTKSAASFMSAQLVAPVISLAPRIVHLSGITPALSPRCDNMLTELFRELSKYGIVVSFDVNYRSALWPQKKAAVRLSELAQQSEIVFVGLDEANELWGARSAQDVRKEIDRPRVLVVKDGAVGATVFHEEGSAFVPAPRTAVHELVGAGDAFAAGWLSGFLRGLPHETCLRLGHLLSGSAMSTLADHNQLPPGSWLEEVLSVSDAQWLNTVVQFGSDGEVDTLIVEDLAGS